MNSFSQPPTIPLPGWYPNPDNPASLRWWDGSTWGPIAPNPSPAAAPDHDGAVPASQRPSTLRALLKAGSTVWRDLSTGVKVVAVGGLEVALGAVIAVAIPDGGLDEDFLFSPASDRDIVDAIESTTCSSDMVLDHEPDLTGMYQGGDHYTCRTESDGWVNLVIFPNMAEMQEAGLVLGTMMCMTEGTSLAGLRVAIHTDDDAAAEALREIGAVSMNCATG